MGATVDRLVLGSRILVSETWFPQNGIIGNFDPDESI
ncbi:hypothetical protein HDF11_004586 [Tunturiibacter psychrotolerans]